MRSPESEQWLSLDSGIGSNFFFLLSSLLFLYHWVSFKNINMNHLNQKENRAILISKNK